MANPRIAYELASQRPRLEPLEGKPLMVHIVVNVEHWPFEQPMPRTVITPPHGRGRVPDVPNYAWAEYGLRCGMPRILALLQDRELPASTSCNASVLDAYPACAQAMLDAEWEFIGHGVHQRAAQDQDEATIIGIALEKITAFTGRRPRGWLGPGLAETFETPDLLKAAGIDYVFDWVLDDLPCWLSTKHGPLLSLPYTVEINDSVVYAVERHASPEIYRRLVDTVEVFDWELREQPRVLTIALHPHLIGVPHRILYLEKMLDLLLDREDVIFVTAGNIADWFVEAEAAAVSATRR
ncbi:MAG TPA: polysaccharide deacetylase family protein [Alphaproteobacteria bacterium]|nr:polysaccharide deacetylase family protein [Alphaproteobacteria bacterium]